MSSLTDTVNLTKRAIIGFLIFALIAIIVQFVLMNLPEREGNGGGGRISYFLPVTKSQSNLSRLELSSIPISQDSSPRFVKADEFNYNVDTVNVYRLAEPKVSIRSLAITSEISRQLSLDQKLATNTPNTDRWASSENDFVLEFNRRTEAFNIQQNLNTASRNPILSQVTKEELITRASAFAGRFLINKEIFESTSAEVTYVTLNSNQTFSSTNSPENAHFARVDFFFQMESSSILPRFNNSNLPGIPESSQSKIALETPRNSTYTVYLNGLGDKDENLVKLTNTPIQLINREVTGEDVSDIEAEFDVYPALEVEKAFEFIQSGEEFSYLVYLNKRGTDKFGIVPGYNVKQFLIDATSVEVVYIMSDPEEISEEQRFIYPFYKFEGVANLDDDSQADFIFLVDAVAR